MLTAWHKNYSSGIASRTSGIFSGKFSGMISGIGWSKVFSCKRRESEPTLFVPREILDNKISINKTTYAFDKFRPIYARSAQINLKWLI